MQENSARASQKTENTAPGKERKLHGQVLGKDINHKGSWGNWRWEEQFYYLRDEHGWGKNQTKLMELSKQNQRGFSTQQESRREHHCGTAKEQPGHDLNSQHDDKRAQGNRLSYNPVHTVHLKMPLRVVSMQRAGLQYCNKKKTLES